MKKPNTRIKAEAAEAVPQSHAELVAAVAEIGRCQRERQRIEAEMNDNLAAVRSEYERLATAQGARISELSRGVQTWCEAHRGELTRDGRIKTARLASGEVSWRMRPPSVVPRGLANVIAALKKLGLTRFIRTKEELDKEAILAEPEAVEGIKGLSISQREDFVIKPDLTQLEEVR